MVKDIQLEIKIKNKTGNARMHQIVELWNEDWDDTMDFFKMYWKEIQNQLVEEDSTQPVVSIIAPPKDGI